MPEPPSRNTNPFATCWTGTATLPYQPVAGLEPERVVGRLAAAGWRGQIVGPHGAGKSALLAALAGPIAELGKRPVTPEDATGGAPDEVLLAEGFERMTRVERRGVLAAPALVVTTHGPVRDGWRRLPVIAQPAPGSGLLASLFEELTRRAPTPVTLSDAARSFASRGGNLREVWFDLYDLHEQRTRSSRTAPVIAAYTTASSRP